MELGFDNENEECNSDARRAYLGCYYLSTMYGTLSIHHEKKAEMIANRTSTIAKKPNNLAFSDWTLKCALSLQKKPEYETDRLIYPLIKLQRITEEACDIYCMECSASAQARLPAHADRLNARLEEWKISLQPEVVDTGMYLNIISKMSIKRLIEVQSYSKMDISLLESEYSKWASSSHSGTQNQRRRKARARQIANLPIQTSSRTW